MRGSDLSAEQLLFGGNAARSEALARDLRLKLRQMFKHAEFPLKLAEELGKNAQLSSSLTQQDFETLYQRFTAPFGLFFGVGCPRLFALLAHENEGGLDEEEQLNLLSLPLTRLMLSAQEVTLLGLYDCQNGLRDLCDRFRAALLGLEAALRQKIYDKQNKKLQAKARTEVKRHGAAALAVQAQLRDFGELKCAELAVEQNGREQSARDRTQAVLGRSFFHKLPQLKQILLQEKLLAAAGNPQEARNCAEKYARVRAQEEATAVRKMNELLALQYKQAAERNLREQACLDARLALSRKVLQRNERCELEQLQQRHRSVQKLVSRIQQVNATRGVKQINSSHAHYNLKSYRVLKRDVCNVLKKGPTAPQHSHAFQYIAAEGLGSVLLCDEETQIELFRQLRANPVIVQPVLQRLKRKFARVNVTEEKTSDTYDMKRIVALIGKDAPSHKQELKLAHLYDDNLNLIQETSNSKR